MADIREATPEEAARVRAAMKQRPTPTVQEASPEEAERVRAAMDEGGSGGSLPDTAQPKEVGVSGGGGSALDGVPTGTPADAAKSWANTMTFGAAPQIEGAIGALAHAATDPMQQQGTDVDAYRDVLDQGIKAHEKSGATLYGKVGDVLGFITPHPLLPKAAPIPSVFGKQLPPLVGRTLQSALVGGGVGAVSGAAHSKGDVTSGNLADYEQLLLDTGKGFATGAGASALLGGGMAAMEGPARRTAEEQALRAAGLRGGIKNSLQKDLGIENMDEARELGRKFLDEGLIPPVGSSEAVAKRSEGLQKKAGNAIGATLNQFEVGGHKFDFPEAADAMRAPIMDPAQTTAVAREQAKKALDLADVIEKKQAADTPGSILGANRAKSDAWKAANFSADPDLAAINYRKAVSGLRGNIEDQVSRALGPDVAESLASANQKYGTAADALKLAANASTRDAAKQGITMGDLMALTTGGTAGSLAGHPVAGVGGGAAVALGKKAFDKYGHSSASRLADFIANRTADNTGSHVGGLLGPYLELLAEEKDK